MTCSVIDIQQTMVMTPVLVWTLEANLGSVINNNIFLEVRQILLSLPSRYLTYINVVNGMQTKAIHREVQEIVDGGNNGIIYGFGLEFCCVKGR